MKNRNMRTDRIPHSSPWRALSALLVSAALLTSCGEEDEPPVPAPVVETPAPPIADRVNELIELLRDQATQAAARAELLEIGTRATPVFFERMQDENAVIRWELASLQGEIHDQRAILPLVLSVLHDGDEAVRERAMWALSRFPDLAAAIGQLRSALESADEATRWRAAVALVRLGSQVGLDTVHLGLSRPDRREEALKVLTHASDGDTAPAIAAVFDELDSIERQQAVMVLGTCEGDAAVDTLIGALGDEASEVRWRACFALSQLGDRRAVDSLEALAQGDADPMVQKHARKALLKIGH